WSRSPFVAAYFACEKNPKQDGAVWALDVRADDFSMPPSFKEKPTDADQNSLCRLFEDARSRRKLHLVNMGLRNQRMVAQQGVFMLCQNAAGQHDEILENLTHKKGKGSMFRRIRISSDLKLDFFRHLRAMNINAGSLFPGIDGLGRSISEMVRFDAFPD